MQGMRGEDSTPWGGRKDTFYARKAEAMRDAELAGKQCDAAATHLHVQTLI
jgi:hypothetical protein